MDSLEVDIFRKILCSCDEVWKDVESSDEWKTVKATNRFPVTDTVLLNALTTSLVNLLSYNISRGLKQRYEVRICIIEVLRLWSRMQGSLSNLNTAFFDGEKTLKFVVYILEKYLTDELLKTTKSVEPLLALYRALKSLLPKNTYLSKYLHKIILRLADLELTEESEKILDSITEFKEDLKVLDPSVLERIYSSQRIKFIEKPLTDAFISTRSTLEDHPNKKHSLEQKLDKLIDRIAQSQLIFRSTCNLLKEILVAANYSQQALDFIQFVLQLIINRCKTCDKDIIDLYPISLQSCVILLRIPPDMHSKDSKIYTVKMLKDIFLKCNEDALILVSHFPAWLEIFSSFLDESGYELPNSQINFNISD